MFELTLSIYVRYDGTIDVTFPLAVVTVVKHVLSVPNHAFHRQTALLTATYVIGYAFNNK